MLRDITIGQHFPGNSLVHRFDPRLKLVLTILYIVLLFAASNPLGLALSLIFLAAMYAVAKIPFKLILKSLKPIFPIIVFTAVLNLFFVSGEGDPVFKLGFLTVYAEGIRYAVLMAVRVMALIAGTSLLTYTTSPIVLTDAIEQLLKPLGRLHFPVHELAMMMSIALRFIPTLIEETVDIIKEKLVNAEWALSLRLEKTRRDFESIEDDYIRERIKDIAHVVLRVQRVLTGRRSASSLLEAEGLDETIILVADQLDPADMLLLRGRDDLDIAGIILEEGSITSHAVILARLSLIHISEPTRP